MQEGITGRGALRWHVQISTRKLSARLSCLARSATKKGQWFPCSKADRKHQYFMLVIHLSLVLVMSQLHTCSLSIMHLDSVAVTTGSMKQKSASICNHVISGIRTLYMHAWLSPTCTVLHDLEKRHLYSAFHSQCLYTNSCTERPQAVTRRAKRFFVKAWMHASGWVSFSVKLCNRRPCCCRCYCIASCSQ